VYEIKLNKIKFHSKNNLLFDAVFKLCKTGNVYIT